MREPHATTVEVTARATGHPKPEVEVIATGNGAGLPQDVRRSGLAGLQQRAEHHHSSLTAERPPGGRRLIWRGPLPSR